MELDGEPYDVLNGEYASNVRGADKFLSDHRKVQRDGKDLMGSICKRSGVSAKETMRTTVPTFQATGWTEN